jgi:hypothetical protein
VDIRQKNTLGDRSRVTATEIVPAGSQSLACHEGSRGRNSTAHSPINTTTSAFCRSARPRAMSSMSSASPNATNKLPPDCKSRCDQPQATKLQDIPKGIGETRSPFGVSTPNRKPNTTITNLQSTSGIAITRNSAMMHNPPSSKESRRERRSFADSQDRSWLRHVLWAAS